MIVFVAGSGLRAVIGDQEAVGLRFIREIQTVPSYRLYVVKGRFAALVEVAEGGVAVPGELCDLDDKRMAAILANEPPGVSQMPIRLADGTTAPGPVSTLETLPGGSQDISEFGGFAAYWAARSRP